MRILLVHNRYRESGGEDVVVRTESELLQKYGHDVDLVEADNSQIEGITGKAKAALGAIYSAGSKRFVFARIRSFQPDLVHVHNFFPLFSPSIYLACVEGKVPVVQTLHNYRLICPNSYLLRSGRACEDCVGRRFAWPAVLHGCYRGSRIGTASVAAMLSFHHWLGTWRTSVDRFIALSEFARNKLAEGGFPQEKISVKPNFVRDPGRPGDGSGNFALFVGRLSREKGIELLLSAWERQKSSMRLKIVGDGPLDGEVRERARTCDVEFLGRMQSDGVRHLMAEASFLIVPSLCYENFPLAIVEAFAAGLPVIAAGHGSVAELVEHGRTGLHFRPGDMADLSAKIEWAVAHPEEMARMRRRARSEYVDKYTPDRNYQMLMEIYQQALKLRERPDSVESAVLA